jgi:hypothetical protein
VDSWKEELSPESLAAMDKWIESNLKKYPVLNESQNL